MPGKLSWDATAIWLLPTDMVSNGRNCLSALLALLGQTVIPGEDPNVSLNVLTSSTQVEYAWNGMYKVIAEVNAFLDYLNKSELSDDIKTSWGQKHVSCVVLPITTWFPILVTFP